MRRFQKVQSYPGSMILFVCSLIFSRQIKSCLFQFSGRTQTTSWHEQPLFDTKTGCFYGKLSYSESTKTAVVFRPPRGSQKLKDSSLVFQVGVKGFERLNGQVPSVWITTPMRETESVGFAINGPFEPDVGALSISS